MYSNIRSRAGLVVLIFSLIISFVSAAPVPISASQSYTLSSRSSRSNGQVLIQRDTGRSAQMPLRGPISIVPSTANTPVYEEHQLVPRNARLNAKIRAGFKKLFHGIKHVAQKIGSGIKKVAQKVGSGIKRVAQKVGSGIKKAAKKVGTFIKHTAGKIAKFGLKVVSTVAKVVGKVAGFIPEIGKPIEKAFDGVSAVAGLASNKIHANLGKKLEKGMNVMNKADKIMGYMPMRRGLSEEEGFQQRDISDAYYFNVRRDIPLELEHREESYFDADQRDIYERAFEAYYYLDWE